jgi:hypothetical protein
MNGAVPWIGAQADGFERDAPSLNSMAALKGEKLPLESGASGLEFSAGVCFMAKAPVHQFPAKQFQATPGAGYEEVHAREVQVEEERWEQRRRARLLQRQHELDHEAELRPYRGKTVKLLRRYMRTAIETGRLPSVLGSEFFRSGVTSYSVMTFEDRVIFVHDMEICLEKLDPQAREILARHVLQGHDLRATAKLTQATMRTTRRNIPAAIDAMSEILLRVGLMEESFSNREHSCQEGKSDDFPASDRAQGK